MYTMIRQGDTTAYGLCQFIIDKPEDTKDLPTNITTHSIALCISTGEYFFLTGDRQWLKLGESVK